MSRQYRHTKIVFTIGPATQDPETLRALVESGVDICRLNMAHASHDWVRQTVQKVRDACADTGRNVAILMDVKGPEVRTANIENPLHLAPGEIFELLAKANANPSPDTRGVHVNYQGLPDDVSVGDTVLVDAGLIQMKVLETTPERVRCNVIIGGELGSKRHINLPGVYVRTPAVTDNDKRDVALGAELGLDFIALSFVREAPAIENLRTLLDELGSPARIVAKIEDQSGLRNIDAIVRASDAVMIARGDLGIEIPYERLPEVQLQIGRTCLADGKPFIIATQLLESMVEAPLPTRAEVTDVANAVAELADAVMLSGETTVGKFPRECVTVLNRIVDHVEETTKHGMNELIHLRDSKTKTLRSAAILAKEIGGAIVVFTENGYLPAVLASLRPDHVPVYAFTHKSPIFQQMLLYWGIEPFLMPFSDEGETTISNAFAYLKRSGWCNTGDEVVVITNVLAEGKIIDTIQIRVIE